MTDMDLDLAFPSEYLGSLDLAGRTVTVKIKEVRKAQVAFAGGKKEPRYVIAFERGSKEWLINKTNAFAIGVLLWRSDMESFVGKSVMLTTDEDVIKGETTDCIRVCGSPDATPRGLAEFKKCWDHKDGRANNKLIGRLKRVMATIKMAERQAKAVKAADKGGLGAAPARRGDVAPTTPTPPAIPESPPDAPPGENLAPAESGGS